MHVPIQQAEPGKTIRYNFTVVNSAGNLFDPTTFTVDVYSGVTINPANLITTLTPQNAGRMGQYFVDWSIPPNVTSGTYTIDIQATDGTSSFSDRFSFFVYPAGTFQQSTTSVIDQIHTQAQRLVQEQGTRKAVMALVRLLLRDHPSLNRLTRGYEHSDADILVNMELTVSEFNMMPPLLFPPFTLESFPSVYLLVIGTIKNLLQSSAFLRVRNTLSYSDGGVSVETENAGMYQNLVAKYENLFYTWSQKYKAALNIHRALGASPTGVHTEYILLSALIGDVQWGTAGAIVS